MLAARAARHCAPHDGGAAEVHDGVRHLANLTAGQELVVYLHKLFAVHRNLVVCTTLGQRGGAAVAYQECPQYCPG